ncbi:hypothetical protein IV203_030130 [Nitzschia inconspicua]|uniref:Uncharacterized protein n=1 Tax=Nitzschia inconspicua TaxID=303405 RepID=A0A9K3LS09_9STRA|nr:hypothetical protein IV203_030130 [Nitzschia inconspicua]
MAHGEQTLLEPCLRHGPRYSSHRSSTDPHRPKAAAFHRGLLRGSSSLWFGRKYHRLDQATNLPQHCAMPNEVKPPEKPQRHIHWNERVRVRRFEKVGPDVAQDCYYTEKELYSFHQEFMQEDDAETSDSSFAKEE